MGTIFATEDFSQTAGKIFNFFKFDFINHINWLIN